MYWYSRYDSFINEFFCFKKIKIKAEIVLSPGGAYFYKSKRVPLLHFSELCDISRKNFFRKFQAFFQKNVLRFLSLRYSADLRRSRLVRSYIIRLGTAIPRFSAEIGKFYLETFPHFPTLIQLWDIKFVAGASPDLKPHRIDWVL